jgi:hypothetical protein
MDEVEFRERFSKRVLQLASNGKTPFGLAPEQYADSVAGTYWRERHPEGVTPECCADDDADYWEGSA